MTIRPGDRWGSEVPRPDGLVTVDNDHDLADALVVPDGPPVAVRDGDLARTLGVTSGGSGNEQRTTFNAMPLDLVSVVVGSGDALVACAHVVVRSPLWRGHWWRGPILAVMNAEFIGHWDVAPRGHPNDGRVETFEVDPSMSIRQRLSARRRLRSATHVPHPAITTRSIKASNWTFPDAMEVIVDGRPVGRTSSLSIEVIPDAAIVHA